MGFDFGRSMSVVTKAQVNAFRVTDRRCCTFLVTRIQGFIITSIFVWFQFWTAQMIRTLSASVRNRLLCHPQ